MPAELSTILWSILGTILTTFIGWLCTTAIMWLNGKIKNEKLARWSSAVTQIVFNAVQSVQQTFVDTMKKEGKWNDEVAKEAKEKAMAIIESELTDELRKYVTDNFGDMKEYLMNQVEAIIHQLKK